MTKVGTRMLGKTERTSISAFIFVSAIAAPGLAPQQVQANDTRNRDQFGSAVDIDDDFAIIGARLAEDSDQPVNSGLAYIYQRIDGVWVEVAKLKAPDASSGGPGDLFGGAVRIDGDTAVVGAIRADQDGIEDAGAAYVFQRNQGGENAWGLVTRINNPSADEGDLFGFSLAIEGDTIAVGALVDDNPNAPGTNHGSVSIFDRNQGGANAWGLVTTIINDRAGDRFGVSVDLEGGVLAVGSDRTGVQNFGSVLIHRRDEGGENNWGLVKEIDNPKPFSNDSFGQFVSLSEGVLAVGSPLDDRDNPETEFDGAQAGSVFLFEQNLGGADNWGQLAELGSDITLDSIDGEKNDRFGSAVSLSGDRLLVGVSATNLGGGARGVVYEFQRIGDEFVQVAVVQPDDVSGGDRFGQTVAASGQRTVMGSPIDDFAGPDDGSVLFTSNERSSAAVTVTVSSDSESSEGLGFIPVYDQAAKASSARGERPE